MLKLTLPWDLTPSIQKGCSQRGIHKEILLRTIHKQVSGAASRRFLTYFSNSTGHHSSKRDAEGDASECKSLEDAGCAMGPPTHTTEEGFAETWCMAGSTSNNIKAAFPMPKFNIFPCKWISVHACMVKQGHGWVEWSWDRQVQAV